MHGVLPYCGSGWVPERVSTRDGRDAALGKGPHLERHFPEQTIFNPRPQTSPEATIPSPLQLTILLGWTSEHRDNSYPFLTCRSSMRKPAPSVSVATKLS